MSRLFAFSGRRVLVVREDDTIRMPGAPDRPAVDEHLSSLHVAEGLGFSFGEVSAAALDDPLGHGVYELRGIRSLFGELSDREVLEVGMARQLLDWRLSHRRCGYCGTSTELSEGGALHCPECERGYFPRVSPAVIMRVDDGDRMLLARAPGRPEGWFSTLAGFVEPGESLEDCVVREVKEEVGVDVDKVTYFGSQPWPFPDSLMVGCTARYVGGEIAPQEGEIEEAGWFGVDDLPVVPPPYSIARGLIDDFVRKWGGDLEKVGSWEVR